MKERRKKCDQWIKPWLEPRNHKEQSCRGVLFLHKIHRNIPVLALRLATVLTSDSGKGLFLWILKKLFWRISANDCFWTSPLLGVYFPIWNLLRGRGRVYKLFEGNSWMFGSVICTCE